MAFTEQEEMILLDYLSREKRTMASLPEQVSYDGTLFVRVLDERASDPAMRDKKMRMSRL